MDLNSIFDIILSTIRTATPLIIVGIAGLFAEKSGVVNIGLEGMMLTGAFFAVAGSYFASGVVGPELAPWIGVLFGMLISLLLALIHGVISISYRGNQIVSGTAINIFASGFTLFMLKIIFDAEGSSQSVDKLPTILGISPITYIAIALPFITWFIIYKTKFGLRIRAVGEHPMAADTVGVNVFKIRYISIMISGALAGLGGAYLSIGQLSFFTNNMTAGRGFIALAALIVGQWKPVRTMIAAIAFAFLTVIQIKLSGIVILGVEIPSQILSMIPYIATIVVLTIFVGKSISPAAAGKPYIKDGK